MDMAARMAMNTDSMTPDAEQMLILQNWFSPAFPVGAFSYSGGWKQPLRAAMFTTERQPCRLASPDPAAWEHLHGCRVPARHHRRRGSE